ncbi:MAG TPA: 7TM diverse intracellular signaling domain-containing protein [Ramlibacter sp.]|nr:7TM diverse intracellular signaling domain-containing protein [Ramlibacter sp.]
MQIWELVIWSAASGAIALVVLINLGDFIFRRHIASLHGVVYNSACLAFVLLLSGLLQTLLPRPYLQEVRMAQVLVGPVCVCLGDLWLRTWLGARYRDRLMNIALLVGGTVMPLLGVVSIWVLRPALQLPVAAGLVVSNMVIVVWMSLRAWLLGDSLARGMTIGTVLMLSSAGGLYAIAMGMPMSLAMQAAVAMAAALTVTIVGFMLWQRQERRVRAAREVHSQYDPVTKLPSGTPLVRHLIRAQKRRRLTRREGAVIAVMVFEPERVRSVAGNSGLNEAYLHLAQRLQHQVGVVNPVGRYWDRCFITLMESIHSPAALRTVGLRVASSLRRPMDVKGSDGSQVQVRLDIGVGVLRLAKEAEDVEDLLADAQQLAEAARSMSSRAATRDSDGEVVPVEDAQLGGRKPRGGRLGWRAATNNRVRA